MYIPGTTCLHIPLAHPCLYEYLLIHSILYCTFYYFILFYLPYLILFFVPIFILFLPIFIYILLCYVSLFYFNFFCTVHWADLSWLTFHYWLYPVWLCMWRIIKNLEPWSGAVMKWSCERTRSCVYRESRAGDSGHNPVELLRSG